MTFSAESVTAVKARLQERMERRKLERDIREAVVMVQHPGSEKAGKRVFMIF